MGVKAGYDANRLEEVGWGAVFPSDEDPAIRDALRPLLELRKAQAGPRYKEFWGTSGGARPRDTPSQWLARQGAPSYGVVDPEVVPYYLLLVGTPEKISLRFQSQLDIQQAVGRIHFKTAEEYASYAQAVVNSEQASEPTLNAPARAVLFAPQNPDDPHTRALSQSLVKPLAGQLAARNKEQWHIDSKIGEAATKDALFACLNSPDRPALLFTAGHGLGVNTPGPLQQARSGALLCQDWKGPRQWRGPIKPDCYLCAEDVSPQPGNAGMISVHLSTFSAATPGVDEFYNQIVPGAEKLASEAFVSPLAQRLLAHPSGAALAFIGLASRCWIYDFPPNGANILDTFKNLLAGIMDGQRVGYAMEALNEFVALSATSFTRLAEGGPYTDTQPYEMDHSWAVVNTLQNMILLGDPAVRIRLPTQVQKPDINF